MVDACNPSYLRDWGEIVAWTWEVEVAVSWDCTITLQPGWKSKILSQKKKKKDLNGYCFLIDEKITQLCLSTPAERLWVYYEALNKNKKEEIVKLIIEK